MNILSRIKHYKEDPRTFLRVVMNHLGPLIKNDELFIRLQWRINMDYPLNLDNPKTFNEKLQWLKLHDRKPIYTTMVDKYEAKKYVANIIGEEHIIPTIAVYDKVEDIDFDALPDQFVMKCTHDSGGLVICKNKSKLDKVAAKKTLNHFLHRRYYYQNREWPYKNVQPRILIEKYVEDNGDKELRDYKFYCFNGKPDSLLLATGRQTGNLCFDYFDMYFNHLNLTNHWHPNAQQTPHKPLHFDDMKKLASKLSEGIPHLRVDFYEANGQVYFGEMTFFDMSGMLRIYPDNWDAEWGEKIDLNLVK